MKYLIVLIMFGLPVTGCAQSNNQTTQQVSSCAQASTETSNSNNQPTNNQETIQTNTTFHHSKTAANEENQRIPLPPLNKRIYGISVNIHGPFELYINDILAQKEYGEGSTSAGTEINPYVLKSGTYSFKIKLFPPLDSKDGLLHANDIQFNNIRLAVYGKGISDFEYLEWYDLPPITDPVPFLKAEYEFTVELPYELEGWSNSQVLTPHTAEDSVKLTQEVVGFYEELRELINDGKAEEYYIDKHTKAHSERRKFEYLSKKELDNKCGSYVETLKQRATGNMLPIEDYELRFYAGGRLVSLLRKETKEAYGQERNLKGWSVLLRNTNNKLASISVKLHKPHGSNQFEIIRK